MNRQNGCASYRSGNVKEEIPHGVAEGEDADHVDGHDVGGVHVHHELRKKRKIFQSMDALNGTTVVVHRWNRGNRWNRWKRWKRWKLQNMMNSPWCRKEEGGHRWAPLRTAQARLGSGRSVLVLVVSRGGRGPKREENR